jgi:hypothetical protein
MCTDKMECSLYRIVRGTVNILLKSVFKLECEQIEAGLHYSSPEGIVFLRDPKDI